MFFKVSTSIIKFALKIVYFGSFLVWKLFFKRNIPTNWSVKLKGSIAFWAQLLIRVVGGSLVQKECYVGVFRLTIDFANNMSRLLRFMT